MSDHILYDACTIVSNNVDVLMNKKDTFYPLLFVFPALFLVPVSWEKCLILQNYMKKGKGFL